MKVWKNTIPQPKTPDLPYPILTSFSPILGVGRLDAMKVKSVDWVTG